MDELRWGMTTTKNEDFMGENTCLKILAAQTIISIVILLLLQPKLITQKVDDQKIPQVNLMKVFIVTVLIVGGTYYIPLLLRNERNYSS